MLILSLYCVAFLLTLTLCFFWINQKYSDQRNVDALRKELDAHKLALLELVKGQDAKMSSVTKQLQDEVMGMNRRISATETLRSTVRNPLQINRPQ